MIVVVITSNLKSIVLLSVQDPISINWAEVLGLGDWSGELEIQKYGTSLSETVLEYWRNYYKNMKLDLVSLVIPALSSTSSKPSSVLFS